MQEPQEYSSTPTHTGLIPAVLRDIRILQVIAQFVFVVIVVLTFSNLVSRVVSSLEATGQAPNTDFLTTKANFPVAEAPNFTSDDSYADAYIAGFVNTLRVIVIGLVATTILGIFVGIFLLSRNFLTRSIAYVYVEILRNTPILLQIIAWYVIGIFALPPLEEAIVFPQEGKFMIPLASYGFSILAYLVIWYFVRDMRDKTRRGLILRGTALVLVLVNLLGFIQIGSLTEITFKPAFILSIKGAAISQLLPTARFAPWILFVVVGFVIAIVLWVYFGNITETTGRPINRVPRIFLVIIGFMLLGWFVVGLEPTEPNIPLVNEASGEIIAMPYDDAFESGALTIEQELEYTRQPLIYRPPQLNNRGNNVDSGVEISASYLAVWLGLVVYTSAFIAEIVRAGIQAVPYGQIEASRALGVSQSEMLRTIILPQALRVIIPPLGNQYLNLAKNSSLAIAVAYADIYLVTSTIINQSGQSVTGIMMIMLSYLLISLVISVIVNLINQRFQLVTR